MLWYRKYPAATVNTSCAVFEPAHSEKEQGSVTMIGQENEQSEPEQDWLLGPFTFYPIMVRCPLSYSESTGSDTDNILIMFVEILFNCTEECGSNA